MTPVELLERSLRFAIRGHQLVRLQWEPSVLGQPDIRYEVSPRPATPEEILMWDRLLMLERMAANRDVMLADLRESLNAVESRR